MSEITFSFWQNWQNYSKTISAQSINLASQDIDEWLGETIINKNSILDIGSGSGFTLLSFIKKAQEITSFDYDVYSVETTKKLWEKTGSPLNWKITQGSILDNNFLLTLGKFNIVYAWGVLHHTGAMWQAIENALSLVEEKGYFFVSIYTKGFLYPEHLLLKKRYNQASFLIKKQMELKYILGFMKERLKQRKNPFAWNETKERGMSVYYDIVDWLGGLPYEVSSPTEMIEFCQKFGFEIKKIKELSEGGCSQYLFQRK